MNRLNAFVSFSIVLNLVITPHLFADSLAPVVTGGIIDQSPLDGLGDSISSTAFIAKHNSGQYRAFVEYDVSSLAGTILSASLSGRVGPNNSLDTGLREHLVEVYTGNGQLDLIDYSVPAIEVATFSHASGDSTNFDFDFTDTLNNLISGGATHIGMRISPISTELPFDVLSTSEVGYPPRLNFELLPAGMQLAELAPVFDVNVNKVDGSFVLVEGGNSISTQRIDFAGIDRRGVLEYDISSIPANADITGAQITFDIGSHTAAEGDPVEAPIYGYGGDGVAALADGFEMLNQIGTLGPVDSLGLITVDIDPDFVESLLAGSDYFGINILGDPDYDSFSFSSLEFNAIIPRIPPAKLSLIYTVPLDPADFDEDGDVDSADYDTWQSSFGIDAGADADNDGDSDGQDFLIWQKNFSGSSPATATVVSLPEPSTATMLLLATALLSVTNCCRKRKC